MAEKNDSRGMRQLVTLFSQTKSRKRCMLGLSPLSPFSQLETPVYGMALPTFRVSPPSSVKLLWSHPL